MTKDHKVPPPPSRFAPLPTPQAKSGVMAVKVAAIIPPPTAFPSANRQLQAKAAPAQAKTGSDPFRFSIPVQLPISLTPPAGGEIVQMATPKQRQIKAAKRWSGQHGGYWVPSGSAGGVKAKAPVYATAAEVKGGLEDDIRGCRPTATDNKIKLVKAVKKRIETSGLLPARMRTLLVALLAESSPAAAATAGLAAAIAALPAPAAAAPVAAAPPPAAADA